MSAVELPHLDRPTVDGLLQLARDLADTHDLPTMLSIFVRAISDVADFECAAINLTRDDGDLQVVAVAGPPAVEEALMGVVGSRAHWDAELAGGELHGAVQLHLDDVYDQVIPAWISDDDAWFARSAGHAQAWRPTYAAYVPIHQPDGSLLGVISVDMPRSGRIPDRRQLEILELVARQAESAIVSAREHARCALDEHIFGSVFEIASAPMCVADGNGHLTHTNRRFREIFGELDEIDAFDALLAGVEGAEGLQPAVDDILAGRSDETTFVACVGQGVDQRCFHVSLRGASYATTTPSRIVCTMTDITSERRARDRHRHDAEHDQLTGLLNRRGLRSAVDGLVERLEGAEVLVALYCDLDGFKQANDLHGHRFGDGVIAEVADLLRRASPSTAVVGRAGGDEFVIVAACDTPEDALAVAAAVVAAIDVALPGSDHRVTTSVGIAIDSPQARVAVGELMQAADEALYVAKVAGGARWVLAGS